LSEAESRRAEAEACLASAKERIAGLDQERLELERERREMEEAEQSRRRELEAEYQGLRAELEGLRAELEGRREEVLAEARAAGRREGHDQGLAEGRETGLAEGRAKGLAEGLAPWREKTALLAGLLERMENLYQDLWRANGPMMVQLAIEAVEVILNKELKSAEDLAVRAFEACIGFLGQAHRVVFQARPQDLPLLEEARAEQRQRLGALVKVTFQPDERLGPGDLIMESDVGRLDATVKHRAAQVLEVLRGAFESAQAVEPPDRGESSPDDNLVDLEGAEAGGAGLGPVQGSPDDKDFVDLAKSAEAVEEVSDLTPEDGRA
jgi:flagellar assembly protein FliH